MALHTFVPKLTFIALACTASLCLAQDPAPQRIVISGRATLLAPDVAGFGDDTPAARTPLQAVRIDDSTLNNLGARSLAALTQLDASVADAYNSAGYWSALTIRGFTLDQRSNYRRDGLPISAETAIALDNKSALELMKGISGVQAGVSAPGGLVNFIVKRPTQDLLAARLEVRQSGGSSAALDVAQRWGADRSLGLRLNAVYEHLDPALFNARGHRKLLALAGDWRVTPGTLIEAEVEWSDQRQPSQPGFSLLGSSVPDADQIDPRINLNNQTWSQPVVLSGTTASLRMTHELSPDTRLRVHAAVQRLASDDRVAFPFGCSAENIYDRYCSDGSFDLYDFRSDGERRRTDAIDASLHTRQRVGAVAHQISAGVLVSRYQSDLQPQAFNYAGTGTIDGATAVPAAADPVTGGSQSRERSVEWYLRDRMTFNGQWSLWAGLRHTKLRREAWQTFTTPWLALAWKAAPHTMLYASAGQGVESVNAPNLVSYRNAGRALSLKASQLESGLKLAQGSSQASVALFAIRRPQSRDVGTCDASPASCERVIDGVAQHRGLEAHVSHRFGAVQALLGAQMLHARRLGSSDASLNGLAPPNVASRSWRATLSWSPLADGELALHARHEGSRFAMPDNSTRIPAWTQLDLTARWQHRSGGHDIVWQVGLDNLGNARAWKESPYQFGHTYLYPIGPRQLRLSIAVQR